MKKILLAIIVFLFAGSICFAETAKTATPPAMVKNSDTQKASKGLKPAVKKSVPKKLTKKANKETTNQEAKEPVKEQGKQ